MVVLEAASKLLNRTHKKLKLWTNIWELITINNTHNNTSLTFVMIGEKMNDWCAIFLITTHRNIYLPFFILVRNLAASFQILCDPIDAARIQMARNCILVHDVWRYY
jgi:hypothetical protein